MRHAGLKKIGIFLCVFESVLLASFQFFYTFHLMTCHCGHGHGMHGARCAVAHIQPGFAKPYSAGTDITILGDEECPDGHRESHDHATCPVCRLFSNLSRILTTETAGVSYYRTCQGEAAILPSLAVNGAKPAATPARAPPFLPIS